MLDIGANYGLYSITAASHVPNCHAYAFECNPSILGTLRSNVALNSPAIDASGSNITVVGQAVSDRCGCSQFLERIDDGHGSLQIHAAGTPPSPRGVMDVPTIDGEWMSQNLDFEIIDFCKIDVEGAEQTVIKGLKPLLREKRIKRIQIEVTSKTSAVLDKLLNYGYTLAVTGPPHRLAPAEVGRFPPKSWSMICLKAPVVLDIKRRSGRELRGD